MGARTNAREAALQMLYALETANVPVESVIRDFWRELPGDAEERLYADSIVRGVAEEVEALDDSIRAASRNWRVERMTRIDRNIIRLAAWELRHNADVPRAVILNEAVELAKRFGTDEGSSFVNGVLASIADASDRVDVEVKARLDQ